MKPYKISGGINRRLRIDNPYANNIFHLSQTMLNAYSFIIVILSHCEIYVLSHTNVSAVRASYKVSLRIAKAKKTYIIGEQLLVGCIGDACQGKNMYNLKLYLR